MSNYRVEKDSLGELEVPKNAYYGIHTQRAINNFGPLPCRSVHLELIKSLTLVKLAAIKSNSKDKLIDPRKYDAILRACEQIMKGEFDASFNLLPAIQGGAGTSINMMVNEVIANAAIIHMKGELGDYSLVHPIEDVNRSQSTNDTVPTAFRIASIKLVRELVASILKLQNTLQEKEKEYKGVYKLARTQLQDAVPISFASVFGAYADAIARDRWRLNKAEERLRKINIGGTAVGTGIGASLKYRYYITDELKRMTDYGLSRSENLIDSTQNLDEIVEVSGLLKALAVSLNKIAGDLRLMSSGPNGGLGEITLANLQVGSSIMPGKVNPVGPEFIQQIYLKVLGNDLIITTGAASGEFELNFNLPIIMESFLENIEYLKVACDHMESRIIRGIKVNEAQCEKHLTSSFANITENISELGYDELVRIIKEAERTGEDYHNLLNKALS